MKKTIDFAKLKHKSYFSCRIYDAPVKGRVCIEDSNVYLCQDYICGFDCQDKLGYKYSIQLTNCYVETKCITDFEIVKPFFTRIKTLLIAYIKLKIKSKWILPF